VVYRDQSQKLLNNKITDKYLCDNKVTLPTIFSQFSLMLHHQEFSFYP
jgi:hypothetical protein